MFEPGVTLPQVLSDHLKKASSRLSSASMRCLPHIQCFVLLYQWLPRHSLAMLLSLSALVRGREEMLAPPLLALPAIWKTFLGIACFLVGSVAMASEDACFYFHWSGTAIIRITRASMCDERFSQVMFRGVRDCGRP